jgi:hypothetical protein
MEAGTFMRTARHQMSDRPDELSREGQSRSHRPDELGCSQLQDLSECARVSVQLNGRLDVFQRGVWVFEP